MITGTLTPAAAASRGRTRSTATWSGRPSASSSREVVTRTLSRTALAYEYVGTVCVPWTYGAGAARQLLAGVPAGRSAAAAAVTPAPSVDTTLIATSTDRDSPMTSVPPS